MNDETKEVKEDVSTQELSVVHTNSTPGFKLNLLDEAQTAKAEIFLKKIMQSDKCGIKSISEGLSIIMRAQDLQLPFSTCIEHIHVINGKTGVDIHIIKALLSKAGVIWRCTKDYTPQYQYTDGSNVFIETQLPNYCVVCKDKTSALKLSEESNGEKVGVYILPYYQDDKGNKVPEFKLTSKCKVVFNKEQHDEAIKNGLYPVVRTTTPPVDYVTEYEFTRIRMIHGERIVTNAVSHFSYTEAQTAKLFEKDTYQKYARTLIGHRAFTLGARDIASDVIMGCMETTELKTVTNTPITDADFEVMS